jgi:omega-amidase
VVKIGILQLKQYDLLYQATNDEEMLDHIKKMLHKAAHTYEYRIDIICLPELWYTKLVKDFEKEFKVIMNAAREYKMTIIPGAFREKIADKIHVSSPVITSDGSILGRQLKIHLFGVQRKSSKAGLKTEIFHADNFKFSIAICYDVVFPEIARTAAYEGADILFFPSKILKGGIHPWHMYLQVRALENRIPVIASNVSGGLFGGRSVAVDLNYDRKTDIATPIVRSGSSVREQLIVLDMDLKKFRQIRKRRFG